MAKHLHNFLEQGLIEILPHNLKATKNTPTYPQKNLLTPQNNKNHKTNPSFSSPRSVIQNTTKLQQKSLPIIACVDDSKTVQTQVQMTLQPVGYRVISVVNATHTLRELSRHMPALILMDINMPDINGYDLCSMLKRSRKFQNIPIIMLTGRDGIIDRMRAKLVGADKYLTKPFEPQDLINIVQKNTLFLINH